jgi:DNA primase
MARFSDDKIEEVRNRADIVEVVGAQVRLKRAGRNFVGLCPFHNEKTPSFSVNAERGFFHCFGCGAGGTVFNFVMRTEGLSFPEAVESLARRYGVTLPASGGEAGPGKREREAALHANQVAAEFFAHVLWNTPEGAAARDYLARRGVAAETERTFMLGYAPDRQANLAGALDRRGLLKAAVGLGLVRQDNGGARDMFRGRLMFPIRDTQGRVIAFGGRVLDQRLPKYINSPESSLYSKRRNLYGLWEARTAITEGHRAIVVEGYLDAISVWQAGFKETVASLGTELTVEQLRLLGRYTDKVLACFDGDEAGRKASLRALERFLAAGMLGRGVYIPAGFDPDTFVKERGSAAFGELIDSAELLVNLFFRDISKDVPGPGAPIDARIDGARRLTDLLRLIPDQLQANALMTKASGFFGVSEEQIRNLARKSQARSTSRPSDWAKSLPSSEIERLSGLRKAEIGLLALAVLHPELRGDIFAGQPFEHFEDAALASLVAKVCKSHEGPDHLIGAVAGELPESYLSDLSAFFVEEESSIASQPDAFRFSNPLFRKLDEEQLSKPDPFHFRQGGPRERCQKFLARIDESFQFRLTEMQRRTAATGVTDEAAAAAQELIALRRRGG